MGKRTDADEAILKQLREGRCTLGYIAESTEYSATHVRNRLQVMEARGWIENIHESTSLWELVDDPDKE